jgi:hypothetical protein
MTTATIALIALLTSCEKGPLEATETTVQSQKQLDCLHGICLEDTAELAVKKGCVVIRPDYLECPDLYWARIGVRVSPESRVLMVSEGPAVREDHVEKSLEAAKMGAQPPWEKVFEWQLKTGQAPKVDDGSREHYKLRVMEELGWVVDKDARSFGGFPGTVVFRHPDRIGWREVTFGYVSLVHPKHDSLTYPSLVPSYDGSGHLAQ